MKILKTAAYVAGIYFGGKFVLRWWQARRSGATSQAALRLAFGQGVDEIAGVLNQIGLWGQAVVTPQSERGQPVLVVTLPPGVDQDAVAAELPAVAAGIPVKIVATA